MKIYTPDYYHKFKCIASACPDSCCKEWEVYIDEASAAMYRSLPGMLGDRLRQVLDRRDHGTVMLVENGRCPMWREDGLCRIQAELGHDALSQVCRQYPRISHDYGDFLEQGLELSCPEAARLIMSGTQVLSEKAVPGGEVPEYDRECMTILKKSRKEVLHFLDSTPLPLNKALAVVLLYAHGVQSEIDGGEPVVLDPVDCLLLGEKYAEVGDYEIFSLFFRELEILTPEWKDRLMRPLFPSPWLPEHKALMKYLALRYWLQAVSDFDLVCRVKFMISACILVNGLGGDPVQTAQLFSKEIENAPPNVEAILDGAYCSPAFTDVNLLSLLLL